jgi:4-hydroxybenzoate polyprenyltransferase
MPIVWGVNASKVFVSVWLIVLIVMLVTTQLYVLQFGWWFSVVYAAVLIIVPLLWVFKKLFSAQSSADYHRLSSAIKIIMLTGILSMAFFKLYQ